MKKSTTARALLSASALATLAASAALAFGTPSCSLVVEAQEKQCSTDADCVGLGAAFEGTFCNEQSVCQRRDEYCFTNQQCQERTGSETTICRQRDHLCIDLLTKECPKLLADRGDLLKNPLILGHLGFPSTQQALLAGENALEMARQEFRDVVGGVPGANPPRPVVMIACDISVLSDTEHQRATDHVMVEVGVPLVFGPLPSDWGAYALQRAIEKDVVILTAGIDTLNTTGENRRGVIFRNNFVAEQSARGQAQLIEKVIEPRIRQDRGLTPDQPLKLAVMYSDEGVLTSNATNFGDVARINGKPALESGGNYKQFTFGSVRDPEYSAKLAAAALEVAAFRPDVVVLFGGAEIDDAILAVEQQQPGVASFVLAGSGAEQTLIDAFGNDETARRRIWVAEGSQPSTNRNFAQFLLQYEAKFPDGGKGSVVGFVGAPQYDQFYMAMYAIAANGSNPLGGRALGQILMTRLAGTDEVGMGPTFIQAATQKLQLGRDILYRGAYTTSKFDANGDISPPVVFFCISADQQLQNRYVETGVYYNVETGELVGTNTCH